MDGRVLDVYGIVFGLHDKGGRGLVSGIDVGVGCEVLLGEGKVAGVDHHGKVRPAAQFVGRVDRIVDALIEVGADGGGEVAACGKAENADAAGIDVPLHCVLAHQAHGALRILKSRGRLGIGGGAGDTVLEQHAGNPGRGKPIADFGALEVDSQDVVSASGKHNDGCAGVCAPGCVEGECGHGDVAQPDE